MAVIEDAQGAVLGLWEAGARIGADRVNDVGCLCMNELVTTDPDAAGDYYRELFGWTLEPVGGAPDGTPVAFLMLAGRPNASVFRAPEGVRPHWRPCFTVASAEQATRRIRELGGTVLGEPLDIGDGSLALARDPQGAVFTVFEGETDP
jgi:hypothetical protein